MSSINVAAIDINMVQELDLKSRVRGRSSLIHHQQLQWSIVLRLIGLLLLDQGSFILGVKAAAGQMSSARPSACFVFGDSLVDVGNNNYIVTLATANHPPYGIDYPLGPTGRFSNGRIVPDLLAEKIGIAHAPPYLAPTTKGPAILQGVNFASAGAGILDSTGYEYIGRIPMNQQLQYITNTRAQIVELVGENQTEAIFANALFIVNMGTNDYDNNYLLTGSTTSIKYNPQQFQDLLISTYAQQLTTLYNLGGRKFMVCGVGPLGCIPSQIVQNSLNQNGQCVEFINAYVQGFNAALRPMLQQLTATLLGATFTYANSYDLGMSYINNPGTYGFATVDDACCGLGPYKALIPCFEGVSYCSDRRDHLFWDPYHPTEASNIFSANAFFSGGPEIMYPVNVQQLLAQ